MFDLKGSHIAMLHSFVFPPSQIPDSSYMIYHCCDNLKTHSIITLFLLACYDMCIFKGILTYLITPWCRVLLEKLNWFAASQEISRISWNPKVHYRTHKCPPPVSILGQPNPVHIPTSHLLEIHPNIIHTSMPRSPQWSPSLRFPQQDYKEQII